MLILADAHRRWYDSTDKAPDAGTSVVLTLDEKIQYIAEKELAQAIHDTLGQGRDGQSSKIPTPANYSRSRIGRHSNPNDSEEQRPRNPV